MVLRRKRKGTTVLAKLHVTPRTPKHYIIRVREDDEWYLEVDQEKRRLVTHLCATPTRSYFLERWGLMMHEVTLMDLMSDAAIDMIYDYTHASPVPPTLNILIFIKTMGAAMSFPSLSSWRIIPGDPKKNVFFQQVLEAIPKEWMGSMRVNTIIFKSRQQADQYLDELRTKKPESEHY